MLRVGLIGFGGMGKTHSRVYSVLTEQVEYVAVADVEEDKRKDAQETYGVEVYEDAEQLIAREDIDIVDICLPTYLHAQYAVMAMKAGKDVFVEKPICLKLDELELLKKVQKETGRNVQVGMCVRFTPAYVWVKNALDSMSCGKIISATFTRRSYNPRWSWQNWFNDPQKSGTVALDLHVHDVDFLCHLFGQRPDSLCTKVARNAQGAIDQIFTIYDFGGSTVMCEGGWNYSEEYGFRPDFVVRFEQATAAYDNGVLTVYHDNGVTETPNLESENDIKVNDINISSLGAYYDEIKYFTDCLTNGTEPVKATIESAGVSIETILEEIAQAGGLVKDQN